MTNPSQFETTSSTHESSPSHVTVSLNQRLLTLGPASVRVFLRDYDAYSRTIIARSKQLSRTDNEAPTTLESFLSVDIKYCVDAQMLTSAIDLGFIEGIDI